MSVHVKKWDYLPGPFCRHCGKECRIESQVVGFNPIDGHPIVKDLATCPNFKWWNHFAHHEHKTYVYTTQAATRDSMQPKED